MYGYVGFLAIVVAQQILHLRGLIVGLAQTDVAVHQDMQFDGIVITYPSCSQVVGLHQSWQRCHQLQYLLLDGIRQRLLHQITYSIS